jgi:hypothetical protein
MSNFHSGLVAARLAGGGAELATAGNRNAARPCGYRV